MVNIVAPSPRGMSYGNVSPWEKQQRRKGCERVHTLEDANFAAKQAGIYIRRYRSKVIARVLFKVVRRDRKIMKETSHIGFQRHGGRRHLR
jgi:hypothetical protein